MVVSRDMVEVGGGQGGMRRTWRLGPVSIAHRPENAASRYARRPRRRTRRLFAALGSLPYGDEEAATIRRCWRTPLCIGAETKPQLRFEAPGKPPLCIGEETKQQLRFEAPGKPPQEPKIAMHFTTPSSSAPLQHATLWGARVRRSRLTWARQGEWRPAGVERGRAVRAQHHGFKLGRLGGAL